MSIKTVWKTGGSYVVALNAYEVNHLELFAANRVQIEQRPGRKLVITRYPKRKPRNTKD